MNSSRQFWVPSAGQARTKNLWRLSPGEIFLPFNSGQFFPNLRDFKEKHLGLDLSLSSSFLKVFFPPSGAYHQGWAAWNTFTSEFSSTACTVKFNGHQGKNICWSNNNFSRFMVSITPGYDLTLHPSHPSQHAAEFFQFHGTLEVLQHSYWVLTKRWVFARMFR